jgi:hypothetical protein
VTSSRLRRLITLLTCAALTVLVAPSISAGAGRTYEVVQCDPLNRAVSGVTLDDAPAYAVKQTCGDPQNDHAIKITNTRFARYGRSGRVGWSTQSPSLRIVGAKLQARLRRDRGHAPRLFVADSSGHEIAQVAAGVRHATGFRNYSWHSATARAEQFIGHLRCDHRPGCHRSEIAKTWLRNVHLEVADYADPHFDGITGRLFGGGWLRGAQGVIAQADDLGSGLRAIAMTVNEVSTAVEAGTCDDVPGTTYALQFAVCVPRLQLRAEPSTVRAPFRDGRNVISICGIDFAYNRTCVTRIAHVDNTPPGVAFTSLQRAEDPELIRAPVSDSTSGISSGRILYRAVESGPWHALKTQFRAGQLRARVDSTMDPPGKYEFMARVTDVAGNTAQTTRRDNGQPMVLTFPLKSGVLLKGHLEGGSRRVTVGYGRTSTVSGVLHDATGQPLPDQEVTVTEYFGQGALIDRRVRTVRTDVYGHWDERLPNGPSRNITASYAGNQRYLPDATDAGNLRVQTRATFHMSRRRVPEGHRVAFKGRIGHLAARIPPGGKLVELEVKDGNNWQTVRRPFYTGPNGKYHLHYRFARFYVRNVHYRFRVRVLRERNWPYKTPVSSRIRKLLVKAR